MGPKQAEPKLEGLEKDIEDVRIHINALTDGVAPLLILPQRMEELARHNEEVTQMLRDLLRTSVRGSHCPNKDKKAANPREDEGLSEERLARSLTNDTWMDPRSFPSQ